MLLTFEVVIISVLVVGASVVWIPLVVGVSLASFSIVVGISVISITVDSVSSILEYVEILSYWD
jgi:hypothetical protein